MTTITSVLRVVVSELMNIYLSDKIEGNHVSWLSSHRVGCECEPIVRCNSDHHCCSRSSQALGKGCDNDARQHYWNV